MRVGASPEWDHRGPSGIEVDGARALWSWCGGGRGAGLEHMTEAQPECAHKEGSCPLEVSVKWLGY